MNNNNMPENFGKPSSDWTSRIQCAGCLLKRPFGHQSTKWSRRFFVLRDGYLLYYEERERKEFEKRPFFNTHPKGLIPLGESDFESVQEPGHPFSFQIRSKELNGMLCLAAESEYDRQKWIDCLTKSRQVTWKNTQLGEEMIRQLQSQGMQIAREKQDYYDKLQAEVLALSEEKERSGELEKLNQELEKEKQKLETFTTEIREEYDKIREELEDTTLKMRQLQEDSSELETTIHIQQTTLQTLAEDREQILLKMQEEAKAAASLSEEKRSLSEATDGLRTKLIEIEDETRRLLAEKAQAEEKLRENEEKTQELEEEKKTFSEHAQDLQSTIKDLITQKELTERELKDEIKARIAAEERLKEAETSLNRLDAAVHHESSRIQEDVKEEMTVNVQKLRQFFEGLAAEAKLSSDKPIIMQNAVCARKTLARRAKTLKLQQRKRATGMPKKLKQSAQTDELSVSDPKHSSTEDISLRRQTSGGEATGRAPRRAVTMVDRTRNAESSPAVLVDTELTI